MNKDRDWVWGVALLLLIVAVIVYLNIGTQRMIDEYMTEQEEVREEIERLKAIEIDYHELEIEYSTIQPLISLGEFRLTAYCSCEICCKQYAINRPKDAQGSDIVYTASGKIAEVGLTIAAPAGIPFGTILVIDGHEYEVQDRGSAITEGRIDVYHNDHEEAKMFGVQYAEVFISRTK